MPTTFHKVMSWTLGILIICNLILAFELWTTMQLMLDGTMRCNPSVL